MTKQPISGPFSYENWQASLAGLPSHGALEIPLYTDANIVGEIVDGLGPYQIFNCVPATQEVLSRPTLVLRMEQHIGYQPEDWAVTDDARYHGGILPDEIAALISVTCGVRLKAGGENRHFAPDGDPRGRPIAYSFTDDPILLKSPRSSVIPSLTGTHSLEHAAILTQLPRLSPADAITLIRAARLYQEAVWIAESAPELSWLMLTSALETAANQWRSAKESSVESFLTAEPDLAKHLFEQGGKDLVLRVGKRLGHMMKSTKKFLDFILTFKPDPPTPRPPAFAQQEWNAEALEVTLRIIYAYRSRALHGGTPFPAPMCMPPHKLGDEGVLEERPIGKAMGTRGAIWRTEDTPLSLHTYEYIVRHVLLAWWKSVVPHEPMPEANE